MQSFIREHMTSILHPFAEMVQHLQERMEQLESDQANANARANKHEDSIDKQVVCLKDLSSGMAGIKARTDDLISDVTRTASEHDAIKKDQKNTQVQIDRLNKHVNNMEEFLLELDKRHKDTEENVNGLERTTTDIQDKIADDVQPSLADLHHSVDNLSNFMTT